MSASLRSRLAPALLSLGLLAPVLARAHDAPGEYFFNDDPGLGAATPLPLGNPAPALAEIDTLALPLPAGPTNGVFILGIRFRTAGGDWGPTGLHTLHLLPDTSDKTLSLAWGSSAPVSASPAADGTLIVTRPASAPGDADRLVLRTRFGGLPGPASLHRVQPLGGSTPSRLYYALDQSPVPASSPFIELTEAQRLAPSALALELGSAAPGFHTLHLQLHDSLGGRTQQLRHLHITPSRVQTLAGLAYTFKPVGDGVPVDIELAPLTTSPEPQEIALPVPASLPVGAYTLVLHLANSHADLGFASTGELFVGGAYDIWAAAALAGREPADTGPLADPDADQLVNLLEYAFGLDPLRRDSRSPYSIRSETSAGSARFFVIEYPQREGGVGELALDYTAAGLRYTVEASADLQNWSPYSEFPGTAAHRSRRSNGDGTETVLVEMFYDQALAATKRVFFRLNIRAVP